MIKSFLIFVLIGFCSFLFGDLVQSIPMYLSPSQEGLAPIEKNTAVTPLCARSQSAVQCMSLNSQPFVSKDNSGAMTPQMFTSFFSPENRLSARRLNLLLRRGRWSAYEYSKKDSSFKKRGRRRLRRRPRKKSYTVYFKMGDPNSSVIVREIDRWGREKISQGKMLAVPSSSLEIVSDNPKPPPSKEETKPPASAQTETQAQPETTLPSKEKPPSNEVEREDRSSKIVVRQNISPIRVENQDRQINCLNLEDIKTEARAVCQECSERNFAKGAMGESMNKVAGKLTHTICRPNFFREIKSNFNRTCSPMKFDDYIKLLACESCREKIPPALMLSLMTVESSGRCGADSLNSREKSIGLFQINIHAHTSERRCTNSEKAEIKESNLESLKTNLQCLGNPVRNLKAGLRILKDHYRILSSGRKLPSFQCSADGQALSSSQTDQWRKAIGGYNGGNKRIQNVKSLISSNSSPPQGFSPEEWSSFSEWKKIRMYYFNCARRGVTSACRDGEFENSINNLAYVETALGSGQGGQPSLLEKWNQLLPSVNDTSHCRR